MESQSISRHDQIKVPGTSLSLGADQKELSAERELSAETKLFRAPNEVLKGRRAAVFLVVNDGIRLPGSPTWLEVPALHRESSAALRLTTL